MGLFSFIKEAGEKLFGKKDVEVVQSANEAAPDDAAAKAEVDRANRAMGDAIEAYVAKQGLSATGLTVTFDGASAVATVFGVAPDQPTLEKIVLCCGNVQGVASVNNNMSVDQSAPEAVFYTVVKGDTLSRIAKQHYADANKYPAIFEANRPMLTHPDKIYPGQVLRIPPL
ncbi:MAG: peptidoglycan-binding protein LysM [Betaproteobacteria bacterium]|nr:peptidoglycan-binding protein LysM [Betaproteobacteria bacterium]